MSHDYFNAARRTLQKGDEENSKKLMNKLYQSAYTMTEPTKPQNNEQPPTTDSAEEYLDRKEIWESGMAGDFNNIKGRQTGTIHIEHAKEYARLYHANQLRQMADREVSDESEVHKEAISIDPKGGDMYQGFLRGQMWSQSLLAPRIEALKASVEYQKVENSRLANSYLSLLKKYNELTPDSDGTN